MEPKPEYPKWVNHNGQPFAVVHDAEQEQAVLRGLAAQEASAPPAPEPAPAPEVVSRKRRK